MAEYPRKRKPPQSQFTDIDVAANYFADLDRQNNIKRAMNVIHNLNLFQPGYAESPEAAWNANAIAKKGVSSTGSSTRYKIMRDADKERVAAEFTSRFQEEDFPDMETFYRWTKTMGSDYRETLLRQHEAITKNRVDAMKSTKVGEAVDTLFGEYNDEWITGSYAEQNQVRQNIADSDAIKNLPSKWRASAVDEVIKMLNTLLSPTGQYAAEDQRLQVRAADEATEKHKAALQKTAMDKSRDMVANDIVADAAACVLAGGDRETCLQEAKDKQSVTYGNIVEQISEDVRKKFDAESPKPTKLQTQTYYDPDLQDYVLATAEQAEIEGLLPEKVGARLQPQLMSRHNAEDRFWLDAGDELKREGVLSRDIFEFYRRHARRVDDPREQDSEIIRIWKARKKKLEAEAKAASPSIVFQMATGASGGQTADGIGDVRLKTK